MPDAHIAGAHDWGLVYLAAPYTHDDPKVREARFQAVNRTAASLMAHGVRVFSPISHSHPIAQCGNLPDQWAFWREQDLPILELCGRLVVLMLDGWTQSTGVQAEMAAATRRDIPIGFISPHPTIMW